MLKYNCVNCHSELGFHENFVDMQLFFISKIKQQQKIKTNKNKNVCK